MKKVFLYASLLCIALVSCKKDYLVPEGDLPSWLGESIYKELQQPKELEGTFDTYCKLINDLGYTEVLSKTGSKTIFPANDEAFQRFFAGGNNKFGVSSYEELTHMQKAELLFSTMLDNAILVGTLSNKQNAVGNMLQGQLVKHSTNMRLTYAVSPFSVQDMPANNKYFSRFQTGGQPILAVFDNTVAPMVHLTGEYMLNNNMTVSGDDSDFKILTGHDYVDGDAYIFETEQDVTLTWNAIQDRTYRRYRIYRNGELYHETPNKQYEFSAEAYYKRCSDYLNYRSSAVLLMNHNLETDVISTKGQAYGIELQAKKPIGKLNGWVSYTFSRSMLRQDDKRVAMPLNDGEWYPSEYDRPHEVKAVLNLKFTERYSLSSNFNYATGRPTTLPAGKYYDSYFQKYMPYYTDRNKYRIPDYMRLDLAFNIEPTHRLTSFLHTSFSIGVYNALARKNAYNVYYVNEGEEIKGYKLSVFGTAIPYVSLNIRFN